MFDTSSLTWFCTSICKQFEDMIHDSKRQFSHRKKTKKTHHIDDVFIVNTFERFVVLRQFLLNSF